MTLRTNPRLAYLIPAVAFALATSIVLAPASLCGTETEGDQVAVAATAPATTTTEPEPARITGTIHKIDSDAKQITILVPQMRAFRKFKVVLDEKSLILVDGQPANMEALASGQAVEVGYWDKGKAKVVDTIVVTHS